MPKNTSKKTYLVQGPKARLRQGTFEKPRLNCHFATLCDSNPLAKNPLSDRPTFVFSLISKQRPEIERFSPKLLLGRRISAPRGVQWLLQALQVHIFGTLAPWARTDLERGTQIA